MIRINITIKEEELKAIDDYCLENRYSRSELLVGSTLAYLGIIGAGKVKLEEMISKPPQHPKKKEKVKLITRPPVGTPRGGDVDNYF